MANDPRSDEPIFAVNRESVTEGGERCAWVDRIPRLRDYAYQGTFTWAPGDKEKFEKAVAELAAAQTITVASASDPKWFELTLDDDGLSEGDEEDTDPIGRIVEKEVVLVKCECGAESVGSPRHSTWCPVEEAL